ncbi:MAG: HesA/MoeB/ThiF family protein [Actinobacteria bacterium]|nr:HesA/MoeB/ThiF family protein [Actinomycetota bacterium]
MADRHGIPLRDLEAAALEAGVVPIRYQRNIGTIGVEGQLRLVRSCVGVCGLGGLGGYVAEELARFGVGSLVLVDGDVFDESNLNRQLLCTEGDLGRSKAEAAAERVKAVNRATVLSLRGRLETLEDALEFFSEADVVVDALDDVPTRLLLEEGCGALGIPVVHGAIAGNTGQVMTIFPGDPGLKALYPPGADHGVETIEGNPPTTPALVASLQVQEAVKVLCGGEPIRHGFLLVDTAANIYQFIPLR